jgi:hypothetical protein
MEVDTFANNILQMTFFATNHKEFNMQLKSWHVYFNFHPSYAFIACIINLIDVIARGVGINCLQHN